jgi:hypothetical protein
MIEDIAAHCVATFETGAIVELEMDAGINAAPSCLLSRLSKTTVSATSLIKTRNVGKRHGISSKC